MTVRVYRGGGVVEVFDIAPSPAPTISNFTATPATLPVGGGAVTLSAAVANAASLALTLDGVAIPLPAGFPGAAGTVNVA